MKFQINLFVTAGMLAFASARPDANANAKKRGQAKKFQTSGSNADVDLCEEEDCPRFKCPLNSGNGPNNARWCQSESKSTSMTVVDADCADGSTGCTAASIVEGLTGRVWNVNPDGSVEVIEQADFPDEEHAPNEDEDPEEYSERRSLRGVSQQERSLQGLARISVLVVYTQGAKRDDSMGIENRINLAITETNQAYANSGINAALYLAAVHEDTSGYIADQGSTSMSPSLRHLTYTEGNSNDPNGELDYIHQLRTDVGADMVALITTGAGCGIAWLSGNCPTCNPSPSWMFSVTKYSCATGYFSFGHELGHNMGAHHDRGTTNTCGNSDYRYGYRDPAGKYRSILSYSCATGQCDNNPGGSCTRSQFFSHPDPTGWNGKPAGYSVGDPLGETNNAKRINDSAAIIAGFYDDPTNPPPTQSPTTAAPTPLPTPEPTAAPATPAPTPNPTPPPTQAPVPPTLPPTPSPSPQPTPPPTSAPVVTVGKYVCTKWEPELASICTEGSLAGTGGKCTTEGDNSPCGNGGKVCWWASCPDTGGGPGPSPTPPSPTPPSPTPPGCSYCSAIGDECCGNCIDTGKPSNRGCF